MDPLGYAPALPVYYCEQTLSEEQRMLKSVNSMMPVVQIISFLYKMEAGKNGVGNKRERGRENERSRLRE